jgi:hypothetical protein
MRVGDGLGVGIFGLWEGKKRERKVGVVLRGTDDGTDDDEDEIDEIDESATEVGSPEPSHLASTTSCDSRSTIADDPLHLGIDNNFRREIIEWMIDVRPASSVFLASYYSFRVLIDALYRSYHPLLPQTSHTHSPSTSTTNYLPHPRRVSTLHIFSFDTCSVPSQKKIKTIIGQSSGLDVIGRYPWINTIKRTQRKETTTKKSIRVY